MSDDKLDEARRQIGYRYWGGKSIALGVDTVTFQPCDGDINQDRVVADQWEIHGSRWLFLMVCDGHFGPVTVEHTATTLPTQIRRKLRAFIKHKLQGKLDRTNVHECKSMISELLRREIEDFDKALGDAVRQICPKPEELNEGQARELIQQHTDVLKRAFEGTTLALGLINIDQRFMWAAGVGDSSIALSTIGNDGKRQGQRLCDMHTFKDPREYYRATMAHTHHEQPLLDWENRILGWLSVPRAIGDFALKLPAFYLANLFGYMPYYYKPPIVSYASKIITPPYIISEPSVRFTDLDSVWGEENKILLWTDGVDSLIDGCIVFTPEKHSGADPVQVVSGLLSNTPDPEIENILGHKVNPKWSQGMSEENKAVDILGNLLGGFDAERLAMVTDQHRLHDTGVGWPFHIDDTSIIVWGLSTEG
ncbi:protein serine/threonine phosphatase 2C [Trametes maxima]|nr:protein serine/threonine phosphatase 2C [Trametes maxima]